jgi:hypothetical protein
MRLIERRSIFDPHKLRAILKRWLFDPPRRDGLRAASILLARDQEFCVIRAILKPVRKLSATFRTNFHGQIGEEMGLVAGAWLLNHQFVFNESGGTGNSVTTPQPPATISEAIQV